MIQEHHHHHHLERENLSTISPPSCLLLHDTSTPTTIPPSSSSSTSSTNLPPSSPATATSPSSTSDQRENNLRCPRCDSSNTKFCYYNNYNLTQPRHFCKTCRRYWTKGGALRNVPIGGGCRKAKPSITSTVSKTGGATAATAAAGKTKTSHELIPNNNILWASPHGAHLLGLLSGANPNSNMIPLLSSSSVKEDGAALAGFPTMYCEPVGFFNSQNAGIVDSLWRNPSTPSVQLLSQQQQPQGVFSMADLGIERCDQVGDMYQKVRVSSGHCNENLQNIGRGCSGGGYMVSSPLMFTGPTGTSPAMSEPVPHSTAASEFGYWNSTSAAAYSWFDLPAAANGAFP